VADDAQREPISGVHWKVTFMKIALAQLNPTVGDIAGNCRLVREAAEKAKAQGADLVVCSELVVSGYPPKDLLLREGFTSACDRGVSELARSIPAGIGVIVGHPTHWNVPSNRIANAASLIADGKIIATVHKLLLPNYDVFDERRYFRPADRIMSIEFQGKRLGLHICEDAWWGEADTFHHTDPMNFPDPIAELAAQGIDVLINVSASPFAVNKPARRQKLLQRHVQRHRVPFVFVNEVGGNDDLVFDGNSIVLNATGEGVCQLKGFQSDLKIVDLDQLGSPIEIQHLPVPAQLLDALILGLKDYMQKSGFTGCVLGLSGGVDSTLAAYIAAEACGPANVHGIMMPSRYSTGHSIDDAEALASRLGIDAQVIPIDTVHKAYESLPIVGTDLAASPAGLADQNLQARIRGAIVMIRSNHYGWLPLATGNKSELAVGYCTLYGDMAGGFAVLADLFKKDVYAICRYINDVRERREVIPDNVLTKAPSAELAPNQFDQDSLPPYPILDGILEGLIEREESIATLSQRFPLETVRWVAKKLDRNEYKRRQMPPGIKLSPRAFGSGRRMPMAARFEIQ
jgi:NAD+ synthase (glutamine-hydrolysing)